METIEYRTIDKTEWGRGEWQNEPDKVQWPDEKTGLPCLAVRGPGGHWCGYVGVSEEHPLYKADYSGAEHDADIRVHGGLTFASHCHEGPEETSVCHIPGEGEPEKVWWFGFDCAHLYDYSPFYGAKNPSMHNSLGGGDVYRTLRYVKPECANLAGALAAHV